MLSVTIKSNKIPDLQSPFIKESAGSYQIKLSQDKYLGEVELRPNKVVIHFLGELLLAEYIIVHDIIVKIHENIGGLMDDLNSFLGYLPNGEPVYMLTNWDEWISYLSSSMQNCRINEQGGTY